MDYRNAKRISNNRIDCEIDHPFYGWIPFTCDPMDVGAEFNVLELHAQMDADPDTVAYVPPTQEELDAILAADIRAQRDRILVTEVDPLVSNQFRWDDLAPEAQAALKDYRRELLDVPQQDGFPQNVIWPVNPQDTGAPDGNE
jgi:hypothetical protein